MSVASVVRSLIVCSFFFNRLKVFSSSVFGCVVEREEKASAILRSLYSLLLLTLFSPVLETSDIHGGYTCVSCDLNYVK